jgi:Tfp pilus assembly protein PilF
LTVLALVGLRGNAAAASSQRAASTQHWAAAESEARTAVAWAPWSADARIALGLALRGEGREAAAHDAFAAAVARDPASWQAWLDLARTSSGRERAHAIAMARRLDPREPQVVAFR